VFGARNSEPSGPEASFASPMLELDPVPYLNRPRSRSERENDPADGRISVGHQEPSLAHLE
jgi:hypothetical protein